MSTTTIVLIIIAVVLLLALLVIGGKAFGRRKERDDVRERFGPEYDRLERERDPDQAVDELKERQERRERFDIRELDPARRDHFQAQWHDIQREFVDHPSTAVARADALIQDVMRERGYPVEDFEQRAADLSVDHPEVVQHYRQGHDLAARSDADEATTEQLREGFIHYRELFAALVGGAPDEPQAANQRDERPRERDERPAEDRSSTTTDGEDHERRTHRRS